MTVRRFVKDESGMTLGLALMMILLISVMGAGLLTFVSRDLNTVIETNRAQRAFEVADAGVGAASRQISSDCGDNPEICTGHYNDPDATGDDLQWSAAKGGLTLNDLDGNGTDEDWVNVTIEYVTATEEFLVISEGNYGVAKRKIEAVFKGIEVPVGGGGDGLGHPLYYTPSDIKLGSMRGSTQDPIRLNKMSLFSEQDIIFEDNAYDSTPSNNRTVFKDDMNRRSNGATFISGDIDELCDWDSDTPLPIRPDPTKTTTCYQDRTGPWNDVGRDQLGSPNGYSRQTTGQPLTETGFGAEGLICGVPSSSFATTTGCNPAGGSAADGVYSYDCTTGTYQPTDCPDQDNLRSPPRGNALTFVDKDEELGAGGSEQANPTGTISFPFPRPRPIPKELYKMSRESTLCGANTITNQIGCSYTVPTTGGVTQTVWQKFWPNTAGTYNKVVFIDAHNSTSPISFNINNNPSNLFKGILVVWCGDVLQQSSLDGIILNLQGPGFTYQAPNGSTVDVPGCGPTRGVYKNAGTFGGQPITCKCWVYANGGDTASVTTGRAGIEFGPGSVLWYPTNREWSFLNDTFESESPPTTYELRGWRELYE